MLNFLFGQKVTKTKRVITKTPKTVYSEEDIFEAIDYGANLGLNGDIGNSFEWSNKKKDFLISLKKK